MTDRQRYIEKVKQKARIEKVRVETYQVTPNIYAAFAICLHKKGWTYDQISNLFAETQFEWGMNLDQGINMVERCFNITGIDVMQKVEE